MAGNASEARREAEKQLKNALKDDPDAKQADTRRLQSAYDAARRTELDQTGQNEQARSWF